MEDLNLKPKDKKEEPQKPSSDPNQDSDDTVHYDIDKFIEQLYECKPLKEQEVKFLIEKSKEILLAGHRSELTAYKGIMISKANAQKEMFKIDLLCRLEGRE